LLKHFKLIIEYDGTDLHGWQIQKNGRTVQGDIEGVLRMMFADQSITLIGSGRTDSGVHARGQIANISLETSLEPEAMCRALNANLKKDIRVIEGTLTDDQFHSRYSAISRHYRYHIVRQYSVFNRRDTWWVRYPLDIEKLQNCAEIVKGEHDFSIFCKATAEVSNKICRVMDSTWEVADEHLFYKISANRFLQHMVRYLAGTMIEVGRGRYQIEDFTLMVNAVKSKLTVVRAPSQGLSLMEVRY